MWRGSDVILRPRRLDTWHSGAVWWQDRDGDEDDAQFNLSRFMPMLQEVVEDLSSNRLSTDEYPFVRPPTSESMSEHPLHSLLPMLLPAAQSGSMMLWCAFWRKCYTCPCSELKACTAEKLHNNQLFTEGYPYIPPTSGSMSQDPCCLGCCLLLPFSPMQNVWHSTITFYDALVCPFRNSTHANSSELKVCTGSTTTTRTSSGNWGTCSTFLQSVFLCVVMSLNEVFKFQDVAQQLRDFFMQIFFEGFQIGLLDTYINRLLKIAVIAMLDVISRGNACLACPGPCLCPWCCCCLRFMASEPSRSIHVLIVQPQSSSQTAGLS